MTTDDSSHFSRESARERFLSTYDDLLRRLWPVPVQAEDIPTAAGTVRVYRSGPAGDDPVVLLAGAGGNALGWHPCVAALSNSRPVIAVDPLGEPGRSVQTQPIPDAAGAIRWLDDVLVAVDARRAHLVGSSYGGWLALEYERGHPGRGAAGGLVDPAGLEPLPGGPEAARGGPIAAVRGGAEITIDVDARRMDVAPSDEEIARRLAAYEAPPNGDRTGVLAKYAALVSSASEGAVTLR